MSTFLPLWIDALLIVSGAALQVLGFILALRELKSAEQVVQTHKAAAKTDAHAGVAQGAAFVANATTKGPRPTIEERVDCLEADIARLGEHEHSERAALRDQLTEHMTRAIGLVNEEHRVRTRRLEGLIVSLTVEGNRNRRGGVGLFAVGVFLISLGSVDAIV